MMMYPLVLFGAVGGNERTGRRRHIELLNEFKFVLCKLIFKF